MILPITQKDVYGGLAEITGLLRLQSQLLVLEYKVKDDVLGMFNSDVKTLELPFSSIDTVQVNKKWFSANIEIYLNTLPTVKKPLQLNENCLKFRINKKDLERAKSLKTSLMLAVSEKKLADLDSDYHGYSQTENEDAETPEPTDKSSSSRPLNNMLRKEDEKP